MGSYATVFVLKRRCSSAPWSENVSLNLCVNWTNANTINPWTIQGNESNKYQNLTRINPSTKLPKNWKNRYNEWLLSWQKKRLGREATAEAGATQERKDSTALREARTRSLKRPLKTPWSTARRQLNSPKWLRFKVRCTSRSRSRNRLWMTYRKSWKLPSGRKKDCLSYLTIRSHSCKRP